jgi:DNA-binding NarL/FixJ family response regulator
MSKKTTVILADDHKMLRNGLRFLFEQQEEFEVVGEAGDGRSAVRMVLDLEPDVLVMDIAMPDLNGIEATRQIKAAAPQVKVIALSMHADRRFVEGMLGAGASGYVLKSSASEELVSAIREVTSGRVYTSPKITHVVMESYVRKLTQPEPGEPSPITPREREVLQLLAEGKSTKEIASHLYLSVNTVDTHRRHIMEKLDLHSVAELTKYAIREGLTSLDE